MNWLIAQASDAAAAGIPALIAQFGFGGILVVVVMRGMERIEHTLKGLSRALWSDLASRPYSQPFVKEQAKKICAQMDADDEKRR